MKFDVIDKTLVHCEGDDEVVIIPDGVKVITDVALADCVSVKTLKIPESVAEIPLSACSNLNSLVEFVVDENNSLWSSKNGVLFSKDGAMLYRYPKAKPNSYYTVPEGVIIINENAFRGCTNLVNVTISYGVKRICEFSFCDCTSLMNLTMPDSVVDVEWGAFQSCTSLISVIIGHGVTKIGLSAFEDCTSLIYITIPDSVTVIGDYAFFNCVSLESARIGKGIQYLPDEIFGQCKKLKSITVGIDTEIPKEMLDELAGLPNLTIRYQVE